MNKEANFMLIVYILFVLISTGTMFYYEEDVSGTITIPKQIIDKGKELCHNKEGLSSISHQKSYTVFVCFNDDQLFYKEK
jgi:hypothetical protein